MPSPILIDGSVLEGGGQLLRLCLSVSKCYTNNIKIHSIRSGRPKPGLSAQHLEGAQLVCRITGGSLVNDYIRSTNLEIIPGQNNLESFYTADAQTAGAISLMLQASLPCLIKKFSPSDASMITLTLKGGTNVPFSPPVDHSIKILFPLLALMDIIVTTRLICRGYYPRGGGTLAIDVTPTEVIIPIILTEQGNIVSIGAIIYGNGELGTLINKSILRDKLLEAIPLYFPFTTVEDILIDELHDNNITRNSSNSSSTLTQNNEFSSINSSISLPNTEDSINAHTPSENSVAAVVTSSTTSGNESYTENNLQVQHHKKQRQHKNNQKTNNNFPLNASKNQNQGPTTIGIQLWLRTSTGSIISSNSFQQLSIKSQDIPSLTSSIHQSLLSEAFQELKVTFDSGACIDEHTADQLLIYMIMSHDSSSLLCAPKTNKSSLHLETAILILNQLSNGLDRLSMTVMNDRNKCRLITCRAI